jgi:hypothetical protein
VAGPPAESGAEPPDDLVEALVGDGLPLVICTALALAFSGGFAVFLSLSGTFLPHDLAFLGMTAEELCRLHGCRIAHFMIHDRLSFGGALLAVATLYLWLALFPLRRGEAWAWWALALSGLVGFASFLAYLGYGYLDTWHGTASLLLLPIFAGGLWLTRARRRLAGGWRALLAPGWAPERWRSRAGLGRLLLLTTGLAMVSAGATILVLGSTAVFVPEDLGYIGLDRAGIDAINPRLIPLIAHDRAGFGGGLFTAGLLVLAVVWKAAPSRALWQALLVSAVFGFGAAVGVHYPIGYTTLSHIAPAWAGALLFTAGLLIAMPSFGIGPRARR